MSKRKKLEPSVPSKAYLVSFGDTMTALLAFFIVLNSLAKEQTGANMHSGTGSFVNAFSSAGQPGHLSGERSSEVLQQNSQAPIYALAENMEDKSDKNIGPDDEDELTRVIDRDKEQFQKFLAELDSQLDLSALPKIKNQVVFDSFEPPDRETGKLSFHAVKLISQAVTKLREPNMTMEIVLWADIPNASGLKRKMDKSIEVRKEVESSFWMKANQKTRIKYRVKPWLFADAKRPYLSIILAEVKTTP